MQTLAVAAMLVASSTAIFAQATPVAAVDDSVVGFSYHLPAGWEPVASPKAADRVPYPELLGPKKGNACAQIKLSAKSGPPASVLVVEALPFDCYGQVLTGANLDEFAGGAADGLKQTFDVSDPVQAKYSLGTHSMWAERAQGIIKGQKDSRYSLEIVCTLLEKGAACWMLIAAEDAAVTAFEQNSVTLEGQQYPALVPATTFETHAPSVKEKTP